MNKQDSAFALISLLVNDFKINESKFLSYEYSEADVRKDFIDKFFLALGWDMYHNEQKNPYEQEVKIERGVFIGRVQKRADYAFYIAPNYRDVKFYLEAKKPSRSLFNADDYFQACRYGWNSQTEITFLFDFEELHILDCRIKPDISTILYSKIKSYHYTEYLNPDTFAEIYWLLSREAVADNSLSKFAENLPKPKGKSVQKGLFKGSYQSIDEAFLNELDEIRDSLAKSFKKSNPFLASEQLTEMTQRTIDRLVFIRFLEDKQIEPDHYISAFGDSKNAWKDFKSASRKLDAKYNGVVFKRHLLDSDEFNEPNDKTFSSICEELAHVNSPYNFDIIPIHILGSIYERFLGKVVIATDKRVRIEEKPEVRKAGGVYYTPQYIVNYIVDNTVGKLIEGKTPTEIAKLSFADISCGSGSFLITVFDRLLEYHRKWYQENEPQAKKDGCYFQDGKWILSLKQKQKILTNNIYGVDLDSQAVEVTQLSLYLKLLEDETTATAQDTWVMFKEQLLPNLKNNIICGNSLIGTDILEGGLFKREDELKLKPMNFEDAFPEIMKSGGFDAIVGNPPYITYSLGKGQDSQTEIFLKYLIEHFPNSSEYKLNSFAIFYERALNLINRMGKVSFIVPGTILINEKLHKIRNYFLDHFAIYEIISLKYRVFQDAEMGDTAIIFLSNNDKNPDKFNLIEYTNKDWKTNQSVYPLDYDIISNIPNKRFIKNSILNRFFNNPNFTVLKNIAFFYNGIKTGNNKIFLSDEKINDKYLLAIRGRDFIKYGTPDPKIYVLFDKSQLWSNYDELKLCVKNKIIIRQTADKLTATIEKNGLLCMDTVHIIYKSNMNIKLLLGLINSKLLNYFYYNLVPERGKAFAEVKIANLNKLYVPIMNDENYNLGITIATKVDQLLESKEQLFLYKTESEKDYLEKKCNSLDRQIDNLVYELYGLTEEEIKIIEEL